MKNYFSKKTFSFLLIALLAACSTTTSIITSWNDKNATEKKYSRIAVVAITPNTENRATVEDAVANQLRAKGMSAFATFNTFPFAGKIGELNLDTALVQQKIREKITSNKFDGLITLTLLDKQKETRYVEGSSITLAAPVYNDTYYGYYSYAYGTVYSSGYYTNSTTYFLETNLYDVATEKLIYTAQTKTIDPSSLIKESENFARMLANDLTTKKVLVK